MGLSVIILTSFIFVENDLNKKDMSSHAPISILYVDNIYWMPKKCFFNISCCYLIWIQWWTKNFLNIRWWIEYFIINCSNFWTGKFDFHNVKLVLHLAGTSPGILIVDFCLWTSDFFYGVGVLLRINNTGSVTTTQTFKMGVGQAWTSDLDLGLSIMFIIIFAE